MVKIITAFEAAKLFKSEMTIMVGGFLQCGSPTMVIDEILKTDVKNLTLISNDASFPDKDKGKLIAAKKVKKIIASHLGTNKEVSFLTEVGMLQVELSPQGTLAERIRCGGAGLGGFLTPTGIGTEIEKNKQIITVDGKNYLLETPLKADISIIYGTKVDKLGNVSFYGTTRNMNVPMATAGNIVIVEADEYTDDYLDPNEIIIPNIFIDYIVMGDV